MLGVLGAAAAAPQPPLEGRTIHSESAMLSGADRTGRRFAAVRVCTYPEAGVAWLWCMLLTPGGFWQYAADDIAWDGRALAAEPDALYSVRKGDTLAIIAREGPLAAPGRATMAASFTSMPALGEPGAVVAPGAPYVEAVFTPAEGFAGLLPGRTESFGHVRFKVRIANRTLSFEGHGQFHEQPQSEPRFTTPFEFASLWSPDLFATVLQSPGGNGGYLLESGRAAPMTRVAVATARGALGIDFTTAAGPGRFSLQSVRDFRIPIYGRDWRGRFVRGRLGRHAVAGFLNSWPARR